MQAKVKYDFSGELWRHKGKGGWFFISLPNEMSEEIREHFKWQEEGWGRMKAIAILLEYKWETAIWYDSKLKTYLLPIKTEVRNKLSLQLGEELAVRILV